MSSKAGQEKREGLRLDLNKGGDIGGFSLNTPDLDKACEMALPTPVLNKKVLDMYSKVEPAAPQTANDVQSTAIRNQSQAVTTTAAVKPTYQGFPVPAPETIIIIAPSSRVAQNSVQRVSMPSLGNAMAPLPVAPLDPNEQERLKIDRKRERNRAAAQRCREKKLRRIDDLSKDVENLESQKKSLVDALQSLEHTARRTLESVDGHKSAGCELENKEITDMVREAEKLCSVISTSISSLSARMDMTPYSEGGDDSDSVSD